jgi:hypothetical protein
MFKQLLLGICVGVSFPLSSVYATTASGCLESCQRNQSTTNADLKRCKSGCQDGRVSGGIPVFTSEVNAEVDDRTIRKTNPNGS